MTKLKMEFSLSYSGVRARISLMGLRVNTIVLEMIMSRITRGGHSISFFGTLLMK